jgi:hypothetical protein
LVNAEQNALDAQIDTFAANWLRLSEPLVADRIVADPLLILGPDGTVPVPRSVFVAAITARSEAVGDAVSATTTLAGTSAQALGDRVVLATISWTFSHGLRSATLVSDFLLERRSDGLRCVAYLPRTSVLDHLE